MIIRPPAGIRSSEITSEALYEERRRFMGRSAGWAMAAGAVSLGVLPQANAQLPQSGELYRAVTGPYGISDKPTSYRSATHYNNFYELGDDKAAPSAYENHFVTRPWMLSVGGECNKPGELSIDDLIEPHQLEDRVYRLRCVEAWSMVIPWVGVPLGDVLERFQPNSKAKYVVFKTLHDSDRMPNQRTSVIFDWPYREGLRIDEAMHPLTLLAVGMYGKVLLPQNGAPVRLVVPWKYGFKSIKSVVSIDFVENMPRTSWNASAPDEYGFYANVNPSVDHPRWSQQQERRIGEWFKRDTLMFNGYADEVASMYSGMDLRDNF